MALANKEKYIRDISMMVRKEYIQFEPNDRVPIDGLFAKFKGERISYLAGSVGYSPYTGRLKYEMFNDKGAFIGSKYLDELPGSTLSVLSAKVSTYCDKAMHRSTNISTLKEVVQSLPDKKFTFFIQDGIPQAYIDLNMDGVFRQVMFESVFKGVDDRFYVSGCTEEGLFNYPLDQLTDMGIYHVYACLPEHLKENVTQGFGLYVESLTDYHDSVQKIIYLTQDPSSQLLAKTREIIDGLDEDMTVITFDGKKMNDWSEISRLVDDFSSALEVFSDWGRFDLMVLGDELRSFPLGTEQQDVDTFISTVVMATQAKCDENIRRLITSGLDGVNHSLAMSAVNFGLRNAHQYSYLEEHGFEHLQSLKNAYDSILKSPDVNSALNEFISRNQNSQKRTNLIRNTL